MPPTTLSFTFAVKIRQEQVEGLHATVQVWGKGRAPETVDLFTCFELYAFKAGFFITSQIEFSSKYRSKILAQTVGMRHYP